MMISIGLCVSVISSVLSIFSVVLILRVCVLLMCWVSVIVGRFSVVRVSVGSVLRKFCYVGLRFSVCR